jgi:hypothetical protein
MYLILCMDGNSNKLVLISTISRENILFTLSAMPTSVKLVQALSMVAVSVKLMLQKSISKFTAWEPALQFPVIVSLLQTVLQVAAPNGLDQFMPASLVLVLAPVQDQAPLPVLFGVLHR